MGRKRLPDGRPYPGHRRLHCVTYSQGAGCKISGSCSVVPVERAPMLHCSDQINLTPARRRRRHGVAQRAIAQRAVGQRAPTCFQARSTGSPCHGRVAARRWRSAGCHVATRPRTRKPDRERAPGVESFEHHLAASASNVAPAAADAWRKLARGVAQFDYDARPMARQLVADTLSRIAIYQSGFVQNINHGTIGVVLAGKRGNTRMTNVDRRTSEWRAAEDLTLSGTASIPLPIVTNP